MSDAHSVMERRPLGSLRMEAIRPLWPQNRAVLELDPQENRASLDSWDAWLRAEVDAERDLIEQDENHDGERRLYLWALQSLLTLPADVVVAARKRVFGSLPPKNKRGQEVFSWEELNLLTGAFWSEAPSRMDYVSRVNRAQYRAKKQAEINNLFNDLRKELG